MEGNCIDTAGVNDVQLTEKHETKNDEKDELEKAMKIFGLGDKKDGRKKEND